MRKYLTTFAIHFQDAITYRARLVIWLATDLWVVVMPFIWLAVLGDKNQIGGYGQNAIVTYFFFLPLINSLVTYYTYFTMHRFVKEGQVVNHITKPISYLVYQSIGEAAYRSYLTFSMALIMIPAYFLFQEFIIVPAAANLLAALPLIAISILLNILMATIIGMVSFWTIQAEWIQQAWWMIHSFTAGYIAPLAFFPSSIQTILSLTPFPLFLNVPLEALIGTLPAADFIYWLVIGLIWIPVLLLINIIMWRRAGRRVDAVGI